MLLAVKEDNLELTVPLVIKKARESGKIPGDIRLPESTIYKLLARNGLTKKESSPDKDHRRFSYQYAGDLWMSDVMHGPAIKNASEKNGKHTLLRLLMMPPESSHMQPLPIQKTPHHLWRYSGRLSFAEGSLSDSLSIMVPLSDLTTYHWYVPSLVSLLSMQERITQLQKEK